MMNAITPERHRERKERIEPLRQQVETWRKTKTGRQPMPEAFGEAAVELERMSWRFYQFSRGTEGANRCYRIVFDANR